MASIVDYVVNMTGNLSNQLQSANTQAKQLEGTLSVVKGTLGAMGIATSAIAGFEFVKGGIEKFHELEQVTAKVEANLASTGEKAGVSMNDISAMAKELSSKVEYGRDGIMDMQSQLLTFPSITKDVFSQSMSQVADIAKQTGHGLSETAIMYGKALNSPIDGLSKMQRYGVIFSEQEKNKITKLQESGNLIGAQKAMMEAIASSGYAGVAERMFNADPVVRFNKMINSAKVAVGEMAVNILSKLMPAFEAMANVLKDTITFLKEHKTLVLIVTSAIAGYNAVLIANAILTKGAAVATGIYSTATTILTAFQIAQAEGLGVLTAAQWALNVAMDANPIGLIVAGIAALIAGVVALVNHFGSWKRTWEFLKTLVIEGIKTLILYYKTLGQIIIGVFTLDMNLIKKSLSDATNEVIKSGKKIKDAWNNTEENAEKPFLDKAKKLQELVDANKISDKALETGSINLIHQATQAFKKGQISEDGLKNIKSLVPTKKTNAGGVTPEPVKSPKTKAEGQKNINIHVTYNAPLIKDFTISTTNIQEGFGKLKDMVSEILQGATHDTLTLTDN